MLTGSVARGDAYPGSDLDLYVLLENREASKFHSEVKEDTIIEYKDYSISNKEVEGISHWLRSAVNKIKAAIEMQDEFKASYVINTSTWVMLEGLWAVNNKPIPPSGAVWAHIKNLPIRVNNMDKD